MQKTQDLSRAESTHGSPNCTQVGNLQFRFDMSRFNLDGFNFRVYPYAILTGHGLAE